MQTGKHLLRTQNVSEQNQKHFLWTQNLGPQQMLRGRANRETFVSATMCPQQCVLVCQGLNIKYYMLMNILALHVYGAANLSQVVFLYSTVKQYM